MKRVVVVIVCVAAIVASNLAFAGMFENKRISQALSENKVRVGMAKQELIDAIGYPPEGKDKQSALFFRFVQSKVTSVGKEESWTYQIEPSAGGVRVVTFKLVDDKVAEWSEGFDKVR